MKSKNLTVNRHRSILERKSVTFSSAMAVPGGGFGGDFGKRPRGTSWSSYRHRYSRNGAKFFDKKCSPRTVLLLLSVPSSREFIDWCLTLQILTFATSIRIKFTTTKICCKLVHSRTSTCKNMYRHGENKIRNCFEMWLSPNVDCPPPLLVGKDLSSSLKRTLPEWDKKVPKSAKNCQNAKGVAFRNSLFLVVFGWFCHFFDQNSKGVTFRNSLFLAIFGWFCSEGRQTVATTPVPRFAVGSVPSTFPFRVNVDPLNVWRNDEIMKLWTKMMKWWNFGTL